MFLKLPFAISFSVFIICIYVYIYIYIYVYTYIHIYVKQIVFDFCKQQLIHPLAIVVRDAHTMFIMSFIVLCYCRRRCMSNIQNVCIC